MKIVVTGVTGYIGGSVAMKLLGRGHDIVGLVRDESKAALLKGLGIEPLAGRIDDLDFVRQAARSAHGIVNAADADNTFVVDACLNALSSTGKFFVHTSGSSIIADRAEGNKSDKIFHEDIPFEPVPEKAARTAIHRIVLSSALTGVRSIVLCPSLIYGSGSGLKRDSFQIPQLMALAKTSGAGRYVGNGENIWSHVHIDDLCDLYALAIDKAAAGSFFFVENGEASMKSIAQSIARSLGFGDRTMSIPMAEAVELWGATTAHYTMASNSRVSSLKARKLLDWHPSRRPLLQDIDEGLSE